MVLPQKKKIKEVFHRTIFGSVTFSRLLILPILGACHQGIFTFFRDQQKITDFVKTKI
jgi:hypothetical protein